MLTHSVRAYCSFPGPHGLVRRLPCTIRQGIWSGLAARAGSTSARFPRIPSALNPPVFWARVAWRCWTSTNLRNQKCPSRRQLRESGAREVSKSAQLVTLLYATAALALMVRSPWLAASYDLPQRSCWPKGEFVLLCQMFNGSFEAYTAARMRYQS